MFRFYLQNLGLAGILLTSELLINEPSQDSLFLDNFFDSLRKHEYSLSWSEHFELLLEKYSAAYAFKLVCEKARDLKDSKEISFG